MLAALAEGLATVEAITARIYTGLSPALTPMASESVLAHLIKLEGEGKARSAGLLWAVTR